MADDARADRLPELALQDTARYQEHLFRLLLHNDDRALRALSFYGAFIGVLITASFALNQANGFSAYAKIFIVVTIAILLVGCGLAYAALRTADIYLPGRKPDFWKWALVNEQDARSVIDAYLDQAELIIANNEKLADRASTILGWCYVCGALAVPIATCVTLLAYLARTFIS